MVEHTDLHLIEHEHEHEHGIDRTGPEHNPIHRFAGSVGQWAESKKRPDREDTAGLASRWLPKNGKTPV